MHRRHAPLNCGIQAGEIGTAPFSHAEELVEPALRGMKMVLQTKVPLPNEPRGVTGVGKPICHGAFREGKSPHGIRDEGVDLAGKIEFMAEPLLISPCHHTCTGGRANGSGDIPI